MSGWERVLEETRAHNRSRPGTYDLRLLWRAEAFEAHEGEPEPVVRARAFSNVLARMPITLYSEDLFAGSCAGLVSNSLPPELSEAEYRRAAELCTGRGQRNFLAGFDHSVPDHPTLLTVGVGGLLKSARGSLAGRTDAGEIAALEGMIIALEGLSAFARRQAAECRRAGRGEMADVLDRVSESPPVTLREAMQLAWLVQIAFVSEGRYAMALGRVDQYLWGFYERDTASGRLSRDGALDLFCHLWAKIEELGEVTNICIGGLTPGGADATNELSYICLEATRLVQSPHTNLSARFHDVTPERFHRACFECVRTGVGFPAIFNDHVLVDGLVRIGLPAELARDHCMVGCVETMLAGRQQAWSDSRFNMAAALEAALGSMRLAGERSYDELFALFREEASRRLQEHVDTINAHIARYPPSRFPDPFLSALTRDCIARARDVNGGGAEFDRFHGVAMMGLATVADSLSAMRRLVLDERAVAFDDLMAALDVDFEGHEPLRMMLLNRAPKYGNGDDYVDDIAARIVEFITAECLRHEVVGGGRFVAGMAANISNIGAGREVGATPDGRRAGTPLSDAASPHFGRDRRGPTAFLRSAARPDYSSALLGSVVNMKFEPSLFEDAGGASRFSSLTHFFVEERIQELQFNFTGNEELARAQEHPAEHRNLVVRVSGFSAYFVTLAREVQDDVIRRKAHG